MPPVCAVGWAAKDWAVHILHNHRDRGSFGKASQGIVDFSIDLDPPAHVAQARRVTTLLGNADPPFPSVAALP